MHHLNDGKESVTLLQEPPRSPHWKLRTYKRNIALTMSPNASLRKAPTTRYNLSFLFYSTIICVIQKRLKKFRIVHYKLPIQEMILFDFNLRKR
mmetsp:Transcript_8005/g.10038  ORF Transcript_8005/g.10038 Transcript_8005/m.10038 type:complete len:94 (+) Transcript_8005:97-378(+)